MENKPKLAIVGIFWDGYYDLWEDFLELKEKFWKNCPYPLYIVNQTKNLKYDKSYDVTVIHAGEDAEYSRKVQKALQEIDADYFLLLLDDFFFTKNLEGPVLDGRILFMKDNQLNYYSMPLPEFLDKRNGASFKGLSHIHNIETSREYTLSCQPAIWERGFLKKSIGTGNYNAWVFEGIYAKSKMSHTKEFLDQCKIDISNILGLNHGALQGKMIPETIEALQRKGYHVKNNREIMSVSECAVHKRKMKLKAMTPLLFQKIVKKFFKTKSVIERYKDEIAAQMSNMNLS